MLFRQILQMFLKAQRCLKLEAACIEDLGSHVVDLAVWLFGDFNVTSAKVNSRIAPDSEDDVSFGVAGSGWSGGQI